MSKKSDIKKEEPKRSFIDKVLGKNKEGGAADSEPKKVEPLEKFSEPPPKTTGNTFKDAIAKSAWNSRKRAFNTRNQAKQKANERPLHKTVDFSEDNGGKGTSPSGEGAD